MQPKLTEAYAFNAQTRERLDYLLDMVEQLAMLAREMGERQVAILLNATSEARRLSDEAPVPERPGTTAPCSKV